MDHWEKIERYILLVAAAGLLSWSGWLLFVRASPERIVGGGALLLCAFWALWQALYEDRLGSSAPPTFGERVMASFWLWGRRLILGSISVLLAFGTVHSAQNAMVFGDFWLVVLIGGSLSFFAGWVAVFGAGKSTSMSDDRNIHSERVRRYK
jgi:hypothetical protein